MKSKTYGFVSGTVVQVPGNTCRIEEIQPGNLILSPTTNPTSEVKPRRVLAVQAFPSVEIWNLTVGSLRENPKVTSFTEDFVLLSRFQPVGVMGKHRYEPHDPNSSKYMGIQPVTGYLRDGIVDGWLPALSLQFSADIVLSTFDGVGVNAYMSHQLFAMQNPDWAWLQGCGDEYYIEYNDGYTFDLSGASPIQLSNVVPNDLDLSAINPADISPDELYPYFRRTIYSLSIEDVNAYFVGNFGILVQGCTID